MVDLTCSGACKQEQRHALERVCCALHVLKRQPSIAHASVVLRVIAAQIGRAHAEVVHKAWRERKT